VSSFAQRLIERARALGVPPAAPAELALMQQYFELLSRWNARINLTALPLEDAPPGTIDRLFIEPLAAAPYVPSTPISWVDVGSGGGSPAIPLKIVRPAARLTMVESRGRKAAFLREAARELRLQHVDVHEGRFEAFATLSAHSGRADLVTVRAVKPEPELLGFCRDALAAGGKVLIFRSAPAEDAQLPAGLRRVDIARLGTLSTYLEILEV
jgi:16S rRNA (guanine527-N7)-methyltransferase